MPAFDELGSFLAIPSISAGSRTRPDVTRAAEWVADYVRRLGGEAEVREEGRLIVSEIPGPPGAPTVLVYGHYDVQPPDPLDLWESDPFAAEPRGEWLYARGVADDKGQLWMQLKAIESLVQDGGAPVTFRVVCDGEEETGGDAIRASSTRTTAQEGVRLPRRLDEDAQHPEPSSWLRAASSRSTSTFRPATATCTPATTAAPR